MFYAWALVIALFLSGAWWLKHEIGANATLRQANKQLDAARVEAEENVLFQQNIGNAKDAKILKLQGERKRSAAELNDWKGRYEAALNKSPENRAWADTPIPPDVRDSMRRRPRDRPDEGRGRELAQDAIKRLRSTLGIEPTEDGSAPAGNQGAGNSARGLQLPAANR